MQIVDLPHAPNVGNARANAAALAEMLRDLPNVVYRGRQPAAGCNCSICGRQPKKHLLQIVLKRNPDRGVRIGIGKCHCHHLAGAVSRLLDVEKKGNHPDRIIRVARLDDALRHLRNVRPCPK